ncbi:MAG: response regulator [Candidatus Omnitrophica bacterium]|nr:response regulator [Candidatus Omnitrophota bacterium]
MNSDKKILIVDDDRNVRKSTRRLLFINGLMNVAEAGGVTEAENIIKDFCPDLILVDIGMPDRKGYELCMDIKDDPDKKKIKIIGISGYAGGIGEAFMQACGADCFFEKPFDSDQLVRKIFELLG